VGYSIPAQREGCKRKAASLSAAVIEEFAERGESAKSVQLPEREVAALRAFLGEELSKLRADADRERTIQERRLGKLKDERKTLLDAHYAGAVPLDLLKSEQDRIATAVANTEGRLTEIASEFQKAETNLQRALSRAGDCEGAYREASGRMRRQFNLAFFKRLLIGDDYTVTGEFAEPFDVLLGEELRRAVIAQESDKLREAIEEAERQRAAIESKGEHNEQRPREPERLLVGAGAIPDPSWGHGFSQTILVRMRGLEPPRAEAH